MINDFIFDEKSYKKTLDTWTQNTNINCAEDVDKYLYNFRILFAYNSNKIENEHTTYNTTREIFEGENIKNFSGDLRTINELQNQKYCYDYLKDLIANKTKITKQLILKIHKILMRYCYDDTRYITNKERPGQFKIKDYVVGADEIGSLPEYVEQDIDELLKEINESTADPNDHEKILKIGAYFHCTFETIHPFADGNGRSGRTLLNYYLMINNHPPLIIYEEDRELYYSALDESRSDNIDMMFQFLKYSTCKTWRRLVRSN